MEDVTDNLRRDGLFQAQRAGEELQGNLMQVHGALSSTATETSSILPYCSWVGTAASLPYYQFQDQLQEEEKRIVDAHPNKTYCTPGGCDPYALAYESIKKCWIDSGIWKNKEWDTFPWGKWKHERPLGLDSGSEINSEARSSSSRWPKSDDEKQQIAQRRRVALGRELEASRPYHQFVYQISKERERIRDGFADGKGVNATSINTTAYTNLKNTWTRRGIWDTNWGILPGMSWKHEEPVDLVGKGAVSPALILPNNPFNGSFATGGESTTVSIGPLSSIQANQHRASSASSPSHQRPLSNSGPTSLAARCSYRLLKDKMMISPITGQVLRTDLKKRTGQAANLFLGPYHGLEASLVTGKREPPLQRLDATQEVSSPSLLLSPGVDAVESQPPSWLDRISAGTPVPIQAKTPMNGGHAARVASAIRPFRSLPPVGTKQPKMRFALTSPLQGRASDIDTADSAESADSDNSEAAQVSSTQSSPRLKKVNWVHYPSVGQVSRTSWETEPQKVGQPANLSFVSDHSSEVSSATDERERLQQRLDIIQEEASYISLLLMSPDVDAAESQPSPSPSRTGPRRSKRIAGHVPSAVKDLTETASTLQKRAHRSGPERKATSHVTIKSSAKPRGISKRQPAKTRRGKAGGK